MDTITQITLGAAVGEACLGKKMGYKAAAWGAVLGVVPDLDVLANPFVSDMQELAIHRGITHSLFFCALAAPVFGWWLYKLYRRQDTSWREWSVLVLLVLLTHVFIDACTNYGTQVFQPFSNYSLSLNTIFILDPFYTLPLLAGILAALFARRNSSFRRWANYSGIAISSAYLLMGFLLKAQADEVFRENFRRQNIQAERYISTPMPFTEFLWVAYAQAGDTIHVGLYSVFDDDTEVRFEKVPMNRRLIEPYRNDLPVERIIWFSQGYYSVSRKEDGLYMHDLRFGRTDLWMTDNPSSPTSPSPSPSPYVWNYRLQFNSDSTRATGFRLLDPSFDFSSERFNRLLDRIAGQ